MQLGHYQFSPSTVPTLMMLILLPVFIGLGFWQLQRAEEKRQILAKQVERQQSAPIQLEGVLEYSEEMRYRPVRVRGTFDTRYQIYIDNKIHQGQVGYQIVTPLRIENTQSYVLVNRGWVPQGPSRANLPNVTTPTMDVTVHGHLDVPHRDVLNMSGQNRSNSGWPAVQRWVDGVEFQRETKLDMLPIIILQAPAAEHGFSREWHFVNSTPEKSTSYAVQWFSFAGLLLILYFGVNLKKIVKQGVGET